MGNYIDALAEAFIGAGSQLSYRMLLGASEADNDQATIRLAQAVAADPAKFASFNITPIVAFNMGEHNTTVALGYWRPGVKNLELAKSFTVPFENPPVFDGTLLAANNATLFTALANNGIDCSTNHFECKGYVLSWFDNMDAITNPNRPLYADYLMTGSNSLLSKGIPLATRNLAEEGFLNYKAAEEAGIGGNNPLILNDEVFVGVRLNTDKSFYNYPKDYKISKFIADAKAANVPPVADTNYDLFDPVVKLPVAKGKADDNLKTPIAATQVDNIAATNGNTALYIIDHDIGKLLKPAFDCMGNATITLIKAYYNNAGAELNDCFIAQGITDPQTEQSIQLGLVYLASVMDGCGAGVVDAFNIDAELVVHDHAINVTATDFWH